MFMLMKSSPPDTTQPTTPARDIYTVSRLNREAKALLESSFPALWVEGEISNLSRPASGHMYFSLKDAGTQVRCALFRGNRRLLTAEPRDGLHVLARARVSLYEGRGDFQLIVEYLEEAGEGALRRAFEILKQRLAQEGLFDPARKKPLPRLPRRIGLITSPSGAVLHDIVTTLRRRFPAIGLRLYPVPVQGAGAAEKIAAAIRLAGERKDCDVLILARGGGSLEDLWAFNEEVVARALVACPLPVIAAIGHETDFTIADFVADTRAPTPTAAAEMLSPDWREWFSALGQYAQRLEQLLRDRLQLAGQHTDWLSARLIHPRQRIELFRQQLQSLSLRLQLVQTSQRQVTRVRLMELSARLHRRSPIPRLQTLQQQHRHLHQRLQGGMRHVLASGDARLRHMAQTLHTLSPLATLDRGYAIVRQDNNTVIREARSVTRGERIRAQLAHGWLNCRVEDVHED